MENNGMMSPADFAALVRNNGGDFGDNGLLYLLFMMLFFNNGGWGANGNGAYATSSEVQRGFDAQNSMANQRETLAAVNAGTAQAVAATNQTFHDTLASTQNLYNELQRDIAANAVTLANLQANQNECCCSTKMLVSDVAAGINAGIAQNRYDAAMNTSNIIQAVQAEGNATRNLIQQNKIEALQQKVSALENGLQTQQLQSDIAAATANVVRYPNAWAYNAGPAPFCGCNGGYNI